MANILEIIIAIVVVVLLVAILRKVKDFLTLLSAIAWCAVLWVVVIMCWPYDQYVIIKCIATAIPLGFTVGSAIAAFKG